MSTEEKGPDASVWATSTDLKGDVNEPSARSRKAYRDAHKEQIAQQKKAYNAAHKEQINQRRRAYRAAHKERIAQLGKVYYATHKEQVNQRNTEYYNAHKDEASKRSRARHEANKELISKQGRARHFRRTYGISMEQWDDLYAQQMGACAICGKPLGSGMEVHIDHCHLTQKIRGLLCHACNIGLGKFGDDPNLLLRAYHYLTHSEPSVDREEESA